MYAITLRVSDKVSEDILCLVSEAMEAIAPSNHCVKNGNEWTLAWYCPDRIDTITARRIIDDYLVIREIDFPAYTLSIDHVPDQDWLAESYKGFQPFSVGPFFLYGSHFDGTVPQGQIGLQIDAATAFGSGEHETTKGCLMAMLDLKGRGLCPWNVLDMGTGSGILAIAAWKLWKTPILAVDIDEESIRVSQHHALINSVPKGSGKITFAAGNGFDALITQDKKPYELIIANILAGPLIEMAQDLCDCLDENGYVVLSGILNTQAGLVIDAYTKRGLTLKERRDLSEWTTLIFQSI